MGLGSLFGRHHDLALRRLVCRQHFLRDRDIGELAHAIFDRVDWTWISEDTSLLSMGWTPELGFLPSRIGTTTAN